MRKNFFYFFHVSRKLNSFFDSREGGKGVLSFLLIPGSHPPSPDSFIFEREKRENTGKEEKKIIRKVPTKNFLLSPKTLNEAGTRRKEARSGGGRMNEKKKNKRKEKWGGEKKEKTERETIKKKLL